MLQQTVAATVVPYFEKWRTAYPDIKTLAGAELSQVLGHWEGLGYYSRCRNIHKAALYLAKEKGGRLPETYEELIAVPGIGDYTARAVLSIAYGQAYPVLDANVRRILQRLLSRPRWTAKDGKEGMALLEKAIPQNRPGDFNEALMQLGQLVCTTGNPRCGECPLKEGCRAGTEGNASAIPEKKVKKIKMSEKTVLLFHSNGKILMRKKKKGLFHDMWMLPTVEEDSCRRMDRINNEWSLLDTQLLTRRDHHYTDNKDSLTPCLITSDEMDLSRMTPADSDDFEHKWVDVDELADHPCPSVYRKILDEVKELL